jgi:hypothetical protein
MNNDNYDAAVSGVPVAATEICTPAECARLHSAPTFFLLTVYTKSHILSIVYRR